MIIISLGCDYHPNFQQIAFVDTETGNDSTARDHRPLRAVSNRSANFTMDKLSTSQTATRSRKSSRRSPVSYLLTNACFAPIAFAIWSCVSPFCFLSSRRRSRRIFRSRCFLLARCADDAIARQHRETVSDTPKWIMSTGGNSFICSLPRIAWRIPGGVM
jgi:hypothetical protein